MTRELMYLVAGLDHPEGIAWDPNRQRLYAGTESGRLWSLASDGSTRQLLGDTDGFLLGITVDGDGSVYACDMEKHAVYRFDALNETLNVFTKGTADEPMRVPNFAAFHPLGTLFVTDSGSCWDAPDGLIYAVSPSGESVIASRGSMAFPNGCAVSPDGRSLWVIETFPPALVQLPIDDDGRRLGERVVITDLPGTVPDGLAFLADGSVLIACYRPDIILRVSADGHVEEFAGDPRGRFLAGPSNLCFFGDGLDRLAVANVAGNHIAEVVCHEEGAEPFLPKIRLE